MPTAEDFKLELYRMILEAMKTEKEFVEINAGELHRRVGDYPGTNHRMAVCCKVMRSNFAPDVGDMIVKQSPSGQGASLTIRYLLPRPANGAQTVAVHPENE
jgi:hypothetical protein